jgi:hypothetical protein
MIQSMWTWSHIILTWFNQSEKTIITYYYNQCYIKYKQKPKIPQFQNSKENCWKKQPLAHIYTTAHFPALVHALYFRKHCHMWHNVNRYNNFCLLSLCHIWQCFLKCFVPQQDRERSGMCVLGMSRLRSSEIDIKKKMFHII